MIPFGIVAYMKLSFPEFMDALYGNLIGAGVMSACLGGVPGRLVSPGKIVKYRNLIASRIGPSLLGSAALLVSDAGRAAAEQRQIEEQLQAGENRELQITVDGETWRRPWISHRGERQYGRGAAGYL